MSPLPADGSPRTPVRSVSPGSPAPDPSASSHPFAYDRSLPLRPAVTGSRQSRQARIETLTFAASDGERVPALFSLPLEGSPPFACILVGHGLRTDKEAFPLWDRLGAAGFGTFAIDARLHGERRDPGALQALSTDPVILERMLRETVIDMRRAVDYLETRPECDPDRIGYLGASLGGFLGSMLAGADERIQAPVLLVSGADWPTMLASTEARLFLAGATPAEVEAAGMLMDRIDPVHWVGRISPRPVLMIAGDADRSVPPGSARALHAAASEPKTVVWYHGGHAIPSEGESERVFRTIAIWLIEHLGG